MVGKHNSEDQKGYLRISPKITGETRKLIEDLVARREAHLQKYPTHTEEVGEILKGMFPLAKSDNPDKNQLLKEKLKKLEKLGDKKGGCGCGCDNSATGGCWCNDSSKKGGCGCDGGKTGGKRRSRRSKKSKTGGKRSAKRSLKRK
jgi:hypothetical protein